MRTRAQPPLGRFVARAGRPRAGTWQGHARPAASRPRPLEQTLWDAADKMRGNLEAAEYKHVVLGLVFLKYVSDAFDARRRWLETATGRRRTRTTTSRTQAKRERHHRGARRVHRRERLLGPAQARWELPAGPRQAARDRHPHRRGDGSHRAGEPQPQGCAAQDVRPAEIDKRLLGELVDLIGTIGFTDVDHGADDVLGRVYEYFLGQFAAAEGQARRRVLHPAVGRPTAGRDARALRGPRLRPVLRLGRHVRAVRASSSPRTAASATTSPSTARSSSPPPGGSRR